MVSTRSGRVAPGPGVVEDTGTSARPRAASKRAAAPATVPEEEVTAAPDQDAAQPRRGGRGAAVATAAGAHEEQSSPVFGREQRVTLTPQARGSPGAAQQRRGGAGAGGSPATPAHQLSAVPLPDSDEDAEVKELRGGRGLPEQRSPPDVVAPALRDQQRSAAAAATRAVGGGGCVRAKRPLSAAVAGVLAAGLVAFLTLAGMRALLCSPSMEEVRGALGLPPSMADSMQPLCVHWEKVAVGVASSPQVLTLRRLAVPLFRAADAQLARLEPMRAAAVRLMQHRAMQDVRKAAHSAAAALTGLFSSEAPASAPPFAAAWGVVAAAVGGGATDAAHAWDAAAVHAAESYKAMGVLLACASADACASTGAAVRSGAAAVAATALTGAPCVESLSGRDFTGGDGAARLQTRLCAALSACPSPLVVFDSLDVADVPVVTVLINVLSEAGNLQANGDSVPAAGAAFVFPVELPDAVATAADGSGGREGFERAAKNALTARMLSGVDAAVASAHGGGVTTGEEAAAEASRVAAEVGVLVRALRRRLDVVLPVA